MSSSLAERADWTGEGVSLTTVTAELDRLAAEHFGHPHGHAQARTLALVVAPVPPELEQAVAERLDGLGRQRPARTIVLREREADRLDAAAIFECHMPAVPGEPGFCHDRVVLSAGARRLALAGSLVRPLLVPGLETVLWLPAPVGGAGDEALLELADVVVIDSGAAPDMGSGLSRAGRLEALATVRDLAWGRLDRWRARISAAVEDAPGALAGAERLEVHFTGTAAHSALLAGWVAARAGWSLDGLEETGGGWRTRGRRTDGAAVEIGLRSAPPSGPRSAGGIAALQITGAAGDVSLAAGAGAGRAADELLDALAGTAGYTRGYGPAMATLLPALGL